MVNRMRSPTSTWLMNRSTPLLEVPPLLGGTSPLVGLPKHARGLLPSISRDIHDVTVGVEHEWKLKACVRSSREDLTEEMP